MGQALGLYDRIKESSQSTGLGAFTLDGAAPGFRSFLAVGNGFPCYYTIADQNNGPNWEVGVGTYTVIGSSLSRDTVLSNSLGTGTRINFTAGKKDVFLHVPADAFEPGLVVKNASGAAAAAGDAGFLNAAGEYATTSTAKLDAAWCVVKIGGAANAPIVVARKGRVTVRLSGNCSVGQYLTLSGTPTQAAPSALMEAEAFAVAQTANASGAGGTCEALLLCNTRFVPKIDAAFALHIQNASSSLFISTISGTPSTTSVVFGTVAAGNVSAIIPRGGAGNWAKMRLYNITRNSFRLIDSVNANTSTITTIASTDSWASGDTLTIESKDPTTPINTNIATVKSIELDLTQATALSILPMTARAVVWQLQKADKSDVNSEFFLHPFEAYFPSKLVGCRALNTIATTMISATIKLSRRVHGVQWVAAQPLSQFSALNILGYFNAEP